MGKIAFVAMLYLFALCGLFIGGVELYQKVQFSLGAEDAVMKSSDSAIARAAKYAPGDSMRADVVYETSKGPVQVRGKLLTGQLVQKLARGEGIALKFFKRDPHRVLYSGENLPAGIGWLMVGAVTLVASVFAHRLLRREVSVG